MKINFLWFNVRILLHKAERWLKKILNKFLSYTLIPQDVQICMNFSKPETLFLLQFHEQPVQGCIPKRIEGKNIQQPPGFEPMTSSFGAHKMCHPTSFSVPCVKITFYGI